jgi:putative membrane protein
MKRIALLVLGLVAIAALIWYAGAGAVTGALTALGPGGLFIIAAIHVPTAVLLGLAWWSVRGRQRALPAWKFVVARLVRDAAGEMLPLSQLGGFAAGVRALSVAGAAPMGAGLSMFSDLTTEFAAKLPYALLGVVLLFAIKPGSPVLVPVLLAIAVCAAAFAVAFVYRRQILARLERAALKLARRWTNRTPEGSVAPEIAAVFSSRGLSSCFAIHFLCWLVGGLETWVILRLLGVHASFVQAIVIDSLVNGIRTFAFFVPASAGAQEGAYVLICALFGIAPASALALSLARRARDIVFGIPGLAAWHFLETRAVTRRGKDNRQEGPVAGMPGPPGCC